MANYKNGLKTKNALYSSAKKLFYLNGYQVTTIKDIVSEASSKLGLFTYYFENKESLALNIFEEFINQIPILLENKFQDLYDANDFILIDMLEYRMYFKYIHINDNMITFYRDISSLESFINSSKKVKNYFMNKLIKSNIPQLTNTMMHGKNYLDAVISLTTGMEIQFFRDLLTEKVGIEYDDAIDMYLQEYYRFFIKDKKLVMDNIRISRKIAETINFEVASDFDIILS